MAKEEYPTPVRAMSRNEAKFTGIITDMNFGCWADLACSITVDSKLVIVRHGGPSENLKPFGQVLGIAMSDDSAENLKSKFLGKRVEVYAHKAKKYDVQGRVVYSDLEFTLEGKTSYYVKLAD